MVVISGAHALIEALRQEKVGVIFGILGGAVLPVYDVLYDSDIRHILARHEQCSAHMADGYARASGRTGVCMATSGPGATNLVTGVATAYMDSSPIVAITGQVSRSHIGKDAFQETDIIGITTPITKQNYQVQNPWDIPRVVKEAFYIARTGRRGPVVVDLPKDVQVEKAEVVFPKFVKIRGYKPPVEPHPLQVKRAAELLANSDRPMILAGGGVIASGATGDLVGLAELLNAPVATTLVGKGSIPEDHPLSLGMVGMHGTAIANKLILEADVLLAVGTRFSDRTTGKVEDFCPDAKIIHIDVDASEIGKNVDVDLPIVSDAAKGLKSIVKVLLELRSKKKNTLWMQRLEELRKQFHDNVDVDRGEFLYPPRILKELQKLMPRDGIVATEVGQCQMWTALHYRIFSSRTLISSGGLGTMGFGFPAAIGAKVARPNVPVIDIAGDGSFIMTEQDLACSVTEGIPVVVIIMDNRRLGMVAQWQRLFYNRRYSQSNLGKVPDFPRLAEAYGAQGTRVGSIGEFIGAAKEGLKSDVTTVIDVPVSPEENVFPMVPGGWSLRDMILDEEDARCRFKL
ncbi:MAG: biosynthetic-type acetolactate synthase large subunit [Candidatus Bathyarchaeia archaeon]